MQSGGCRSLHPSGTDPEHFWADDDAVAAMMLECSTAAKQADVLVASAGFFRMWVGGLGGGRGILRVLRVVLAMRTAF